MTITTANVPNGAEALTAARGRRAAAWNDLKQKQVALSMLRDAHRQRTEAVTEAESTERAAVNEDAAVRASRAKHDAEARFAFVTRRLAEAQSEADAAINEMAEANADVHRAALAVELDKGHGLFAEWRELEKRRQDIRERLFGLHLAFPGALTAEQLHDLDFGLAHPSADLRVGIPAVAQLIGTSPIRSDLALSRRRVLDHAESWRQQVANLETEENSAK